MTGSTFFAGVVLFGASQLLHFLLNPGFWTFVLCAIGLFGVYHLVVSAAPKGQAWGEEQDSALKEIL